MAQDRLHVVPHENGWAVKKENTSGTESTHSTQREAIDAARELCRKNESDLVIHRLDGTIRNVYVYGESNNNASDYEEDKEMANNRTETRERVEISDVASVGSRISWGAILAGAFVALAMMITLGLLMSAIGLTINDQVNMTDRTKFYGGLIATAVIVLGSLFVGGYIVSCATAGETKTESIMYGIILWGTVVAIMTALTAAGVNAGANAVMAARNNANSVILPPDEWLTSQGGLTPAQVERFHNYRDDITADRTAAAWWSFMGILLSMAAAVGGSIVGAGPNLLLRRTAATTQVPTGARVSTTA